jgi:O-antigen/teichoic acid export membrane protein
VKSLAVRNGIWNAASTAVMSMTAIAGSILVVRTFTPEQYGTFSYYLWLAGIVVAMGTLAFPLSLTKVTSELLGEDDYAEAGALSFWVLALVFAVNVLIIAALIAIAITKSGPERIFLLIIAGVAAPSSMAAVSLSVLWGHQRYKPVAITMLIACAVQITLISVAFVLGWSIAGFLIATLSMSVVQSIGLFLIFLVERRQRLTLQFRVPGRTTSKRFFAFLAPATLSQLITIIVWERSEVFFLERFSTLTQVGIYSLAYTTVAILLTLGWSLVNAYYPAISSDFGARNWAGIQQKFAQGTTLAVVYAVPLTFGGLVTIEHVFRILYGEKMLASVPVAQFLFIGLVPGVLGGMFGIAIGALGGMWLLVRVGSVVAIVNIALALILIPMYGATGAAVANTSSQFVHVTVLLYMVIVRYHLLIPWRNLFKVVALGSGTTLILPLILESWLPGVAGLALAIIAASSTYVLGLWAAGYVQLFDRADLDFASVSEHPT